MTDNPYEQKCHRLVDYAMASLVEDSNDQPLGLQHVVRTELSSNLESKEPATVASNTTTCEANPSREKELLSRPILVGYAFGPKKMITMGVVMAEASKTNLSSVKTTVLVEEDETADDEDADDDENDETVHNSYDIVCHEDEDENDHFINGTFTTASSGQACQPAGPEDHPGPPKVVAFSDKAIKASTHSSTAPPASSNGMPPRTSPSRRVMPDIISLDYNGGLKNIVRYLHSSCSSVDTNSTSTTLLTTGTTITAVTPSSASTCGKISASTNNGNDGCEEIQQRLRVSFVPLDPDVPLEEQHGAKLDIVLHKLTEDILCLSKCSRQYPTLEKSLGHLNDDFERTLEDSFPRLPRDAKAAILRVHRLMQFHKKHPECPLADDPANVLTLMSRSDIAHALADCLVEVTSASGIPVASPKFVVWDPSEDHKQTMEEQTQCIAKLLKDAKMTYPLIAKPLQAAGTKLSHHMTVLLNENSLEHIHGTPCLLQEYANHDAVLYKVYVLGNNVRVYQRPSLPNLPPLESDSDVLSRGSDSWQKAPSYVDFDSQRPYPRLSAFGVMEQGKKIQHDRIPPPFLSSFPVASSSSSTTTSSRKPSVAVTTEEVEPVVNVLKQAFGLDLFGFDILITSSESSQFQEAGDDGDEIDQSPKRQMLVVDVNYFPSYKEVSNFPSLLAQYLTQRAIDSRRQQQHQQHRPMYQKHG